MSAILSIDTLNDFISPSVACIKPIESLPPNNATPDEVQIHDPSRPAPSTSDPVQISLTDCLACSGCVTSAEAVLVSLQSHAEVLNALDASPSLEPADGDEGLGLSGRAGAGTPEGTLYVASISPQTLASLSATLALPPPTTRNVMQQFLAGPRGLAAGGKHRNKFHWVIETSAAREACLVLGADEVWRGANEPSPARPVLSSACPGWICYAEKTHPHVLPHLSRLKSPQALTGTLVKSVLSKKYGIAPDRIWHVAIMPCFDKKLEASRDELTAQSWAPSPTAPAATSAARDVDCVITSKEVLMLAGARGIDLLALPRTALPRPAFPDALLDRFLFAAPRRANTPRAAAAGTSGGHLWYILHHIASLHPRSSIRSARGRNADVVEYTVTAASGAVLFKGARYYGFRNIQNLVRRLKPARPSRMPGATRVVGAPRAPAKDGVEPGYVEVMACPGGCTNGGGQVKADDAIVRTLHGPRPTDGTAGEGVRGQKEWLAQVDEAYFSAEEGNEEDARGDGHGAGDEVDGISPAYVRRVLAHWAALTGVEVERLAYTSFREVVSDVGKKVSDAERVSRLAGKVGGGW